jgi:heme/copper-type cytochrome/quinol oxidase subunit 2
VIVTAIIVLVIFGLLVLFAEKVRSTPTKGEIEEQKRLDELGRKWRAERDQEGK